MNTTDIRQEYEEFLYNEGRLMDESRYEEWLQLWDTQCLYWVPLNEAETPPEDRISLIYENREKLEDRIVRLASNAALAQSPHSRMMRSFSNVRILAATQEALSGSANFIIGEVRYDQQQVWFGRAEHELVRVGGSLKIRHKKVVMLSNDMTTGNMSFLV